MPIHPYNLQQALAHFERSYVHNILVLAAGNTTEAAKMLGIRVKTLETKLKKYQEGVTTLKKKGPKGAAHERELRLS